MNYPCRMNEEIIFITRVLNKSIVYVKVQTYTRAQKTVSLSYRTKQLSALSICHVLGRFYDRSDLKRHFTAANNEYTKLVMQEALRNTYNDNEGTNHNESRGGRIFKVLNTNHILHNNYSDLK